jgi:acyl-CoA thioesterase FadM
MNPPAWRQDRALYPHSIRVQTRYHDEDRLGHVNNIAVAAYYDEARSQLMRRTLLWVFLELAIATMNSQGLARR